ncbi:hypothetical protein VUR80DRAFT_1029 [Thermomyces stellatus]
MDASGATNQIIKETRRDEKVLLSCRALRVFAVTGRGQVGVRGESILDIFLILSRRVAFSWGQLGPCHRWTHVIPAPRCELLGCPAPSERSRGCFGVCPNLDVSSDA